MRGRTLQVSGCVLAGACTRQLGRYPGTHRCTQDGLEMNRGMTSKARLHCVVATIDVLRVPRCEVPL